MRTESYRPRVKVPKPDHRQLKSWAALRGLTVQEALVLAIRRFLDDQARNPPPPEEA